MSPELPPSRPVSDLGDSFGLNQLPPARAKTPQSVRSGARSAKTGSRMGAVRRDTEDDLNASKMSWTGMNANGGAGGLARDADLASDIQEGSTSEVGHVRVLPPSRPFHVTDKMIPARAGPGRRAAWLLSLLRVVVGEHGPLAEQPS